jgi:hypothetical protein
MRPRLARTLTALVVAGLLAAATGCTAGNPTGATPTGSGTTPARATPSPTPTRSPYPTAPPTNPAVVFAADGIGGYTIGADLTDLQIRGMVTNIAPVPLCVDTRQAEATGVYAGKLSLTFRAAQLTAIHTTDPGYVTPSGVKVGLAVADLDSTYGPRAALISGKAGQAITVRVPATTLALVFALDPTDKVVAGMFAGQAQPAEDAATTGQVC